MVPKSPGPEVFCYLRVQVMTRVRVSFRVRVMVRLCVALGLHNWPNAQRVLSNAQIDHMRIDTASRNN